MKSQAGSGAGLAKDIAKIRVTQQRTDSNLEESKEDQRPTGGGPAPRGGSMVDALWSPEGGRRWWRGRLARANTERDRILRTAVARSATVAERVETLAYWRLCTAGSVRSVEGFGFQSSASHPRSQNRQKIPWLLPSQRCGAHERGATRRLLPSTDLAGDLPH